ncbi:hypothetical protein MMPV_005463 [Pyropia vietnamensis]
MATAAAAAVVEPGGGAGAGVWPLTLAARGVPDVQAEPGHPLRVRQSRAALEVETSLASRPPTGAARGVPVASRARRLPRSAVRQSAEGLKVEAALATGGAGGAARSSPFDGDAAAGEEGTADGNGHRVVPLVDGSAKETIAFWLRPDSGGSVRRASVSVADEEILTGVEVGEVGAPAGDPTDWAEVVVTFAFDGLPGTTAYTLEVEVGAPGGGGGGNDGDKGNDDDGDDDGGGGGETTTLTVTRFYTAVGVAVYTRPADGGAATVLTGSGRDGLLVGDWLTFIARPVVTLRSRVVGPPPGTDGSVDTAALNASLFEQTGDVYLNVVSFNASGCAPLVGGADTTSDDDVTPPAAYGARAHSGPPSSSLSGGGRDGGGDSSIGDPADDDPDANGDDPAAAVEPEAAASVNEILPDGCGLGFSADGNRLSMRFNLFRVGTGGFSVVFRWPGLIEAVGGRGTAGGGDDGPGPREYTNTLNVALAQGPPPPIVLAGYDAVLDAYGGETLALSAFNVASPPVQPFRFKRLSMLVKSKCPTAGSGAPGVGEEDNDPLDALDGAGNDDDADTVGAVTGGTNDDDGTAAISFPWVQAASSLTAQPWQTVAFRTPVLTDLSPGHDSLYCVRVLSSLVSIDLLREAEQDPQRFRFSVAPDGVALPRSPAAETVPVDGASAPAGGVTASPSAVAGANDTVLAFEVNLAPYTELTFSQHKSDQLAGAVAAAVGIDPASIYLIAATPQRFPTTLQSSVAGGDVDSNEDGGSSDDDDDDNDDENADALTTGDALRATAAADDDDDKGQKQGADEDEDRKPQFRGLRVLYVIAPAVGGSALDVSALSNALVAFIRPQSNADDAAVLAAERRAIVAPSRLDRAIYLLPSQVALAAMPSTRTRAEATDAIRLPPGVADITRELAGVAGLSIAGTVAVVVTVAAAVTAMVLGLLCVHHAVHGIGSDYSCSESDAMSLIGGGGGLGGGGGGNLKDVPDPHAVMYKMPVLRDKDGRRSTDVYSVAADGDDGLGGSLFGGGMDGGGGAGSLNDGLWDPTAEAAAGRGGVGIGGDGYGGAGVYGGPVMPTARPSSLTAPDSRGVMYNHPVAPTVTASVSLEGFGGRGSGGGGIIGGGGGGMDAGGGALSSYGAGTAERAQVSRARRAANVVQRALQLNMLGKRGRGGGGGAGGGAATGAFARPPLPLGGAGGLGVAPPGGAGSGAGSEAPPGGTASGDVGRGGRRVLYEEEHVPSYMAMGGPWGGGRQ